MGFRIRAITRKIRETMTMITPRETTLILVSAGNNNNKFYRVAIDEQGNLTKTWGRVGTKGTSSVKSRASVDEYYKAIKAKTGKGYKETETFTGSGVNNASLTTKDKLNSIAKKNLVSEKGTNDAILERLIDMLVDQNNHAIIEASGGQMQVNDDGLIMTPLGLVSLNSISKAKRLLNELTVSFNIDSLNDYLTFVPQRVGHSRGWAEKFLDSPEKVKAQRDLLDQLTESLSLYENRKRLKGKKTAEVEADEENYDDLFRYKIRVLEDTKEFNRIRDFYNSKRKSIHSSSRLNLKRVYILEDQTGQAGYEKKSKAVGNTKELWHGTRVWNVLSILRTGLKIMPEKDIESVNINGKMYGYGAYFSDESTKSLNYSYGYWDGGSRFNNCFMFLSEIAMGNIYYAKRDRNYMNNYVQKHGGYDSLFAQGGRSSVRNNEMIVWDENQINMRYLCEFE